MTEAKTNRDAEPAPDAASEPQSLGAVSLDSAAYAKTAAELPAARRKPDDANAPVVEPEAAPRRAALRFRLIVGAAVTGCVAILALAAVRTAAHEPRADHGTNALMAPAAVAPPAMAPAAAAVALPSPSPLPESPPAPPAVPLKAAAVAAPPPAVTATPLAAPAPTTEPAATIDATEPGSTAKRATIRVARAGQSLTVDGKRTNGTSVVVACGAHTVAVGAEKPRRVDVPCGRTLLVDVGKSTLAKTDRAKADGKVHAGHVALPKKH